MHPFCTFRSPADGCNIALALIELTAVVLSVIAWLRQLSNITPVCADFGVVSAHRVRRHSMRSAVQNANRLIANVSFDSARRVVFLVSCTLMLGPGYLHSQCPDNGQTKVIKPDKGTGYYFYKFLGDGSFRYFIDGKTFSFNDKDDPGKTIIFIDDMAYESIEKDKDWD